MYITRLRAAFKDYIWGGNKLNSRYSKNSGFLKTAESWELSCHKDGLSIIDDGIYKGISLDEIIKKDGVDAIGKKAAGFEFFPVLIKLIDAAESLSVQVHPSDDYALKNEGQYGKTEMWYVMEAEEGASLVYGLKHSISKNELISKAQDGSIEDALNYVKVKKGDVFFIESGIIHAIGKGLLIAEIQQNSNLTYRLYDYKRVDAAGKERELHYEKAAMVAILSPSPLKAGNILPYEENGAEVSLLCNCPYFTVKKAVISQSYEIIPQDSFVGVLVVDGVCVLDGLELKTGSCAFVPASVKSAVVKGEATILMTYIS